MRIVLKVVGYLCVGALIWGALTAPAQTADTLVNVGQGLGWVGDRIGTLLGGVADHLPKGNGGAA